MCWYISVIIMGSLVSVTVVSADKGDMILYTKRESSISMEILEIVINESFTTSLCCNAYISGRSAEIQNIFNKFVKIYPYGYTLNNRTYNCDGYLMVFTSADSITMTMKNVPTNIARIELLIIVDDDVEDSMDIFKVVMYENVNVNIVAWNGQWTLSENYLAPRVFRKMSRFGIQIGENWEGGMIGHINKKTVDIAFTSIWLTADKLLFANMTQPWTMLHIHFIVPRPKPHTDFWALTRLLSPQLWASIVATLIIQSIWVHTRAKISSRVPERFRSFAITWTELMGRLVGMWAPTNIQGFKIQFQIWHMMGILLVTAYSSSLAAKLTNPRFEERIDTAQEFIIANLTWGAKFFPPSVFEMFDNSDPYARQYVSHFEPEIDEEDRRKKMLKGNYAVLGNILGSSYFPFRFVSNKELKDFRVMQDSVANVYTSFAVQPWLVQSVNQVMSRMQSAGLVMYHIENVLHERTGSALREVNIEHDGIKGIPSVLQLGPLGAGFVVLIVGLSISTVVFCLEVRSVSADKSFRDIWHRIRAKRNSMFNKLKPKKLRSILLPKSK